MQVLSPTYVTRIDTNQIAYEPREVLFYRVLVLDRYNLRPPSQPVKLRVVLLNPKSEVALERISPSGDGGILAGELPIGEKCLAGNYVLQVIPAPGETMPIQTASHRLEVVREVRVPDIQFDKKDGY